MSRAQSIIIRPIISEKSFDLMTYNKYTFEVDKRARKEEIAQAIEELFDVTVVKVNTINVTGKPKRVRYQPGYTKSWKKAIVTVQEGDEIEIFAS